MWMNTGGRPTPVSARAISHKRANNPSLSVPPRVEPRAARAGFTLVELLIVVAIIAIIAAVSIPSLLRSRAAANEGATVGTLRTAATFQAVFRSQGEVDQNADGVGEYALLGELSSELALRPGTSRIANPIYMSQQFNTGGNTGNGVASKCGFFYRIYLSNATPGDLTATGTDKELGGNSAIGGPAVDPEAIRMQENSYALYAWPMELHMTGNRCFFSNESADIYFTKMEAATYNNLPATPQANAAYQIGTSVFRGKIASGTTPGNDTNNWFPAGGH